MGTRAGRGRERTDARVGVHQPVQPVSGLRRGNLLEKRAQGLTHFFAVVAGPWCASEPCNGLRATALTDRVLLAVP